MYPLRSFRLSLQKSLGRSCTKASRASASFQSFCLRQFLTFYVRNGSPCVTSSNLIPLNMTIRWQTSPHPERIELNFRSRRFARQCNSGFLLLWRRSARSWIQRRFDARDTEETVNCAYFLRMRQARLMCSSTRWKLHRRLRRMPSIMENRSASGMVKS